MNKSLLHKGSILRSTTIGFVLITLCLVLPANTNGNTLGNHQPMAGKLDTNASRSKELYVEPEFRFDTFKSMTVDISVVDLNGNPVAGAIALISNIPKDVSDLYDQRLEQKSLIGIVRSDQYGRVYQTLELSSSVTRVLLELNIQSENNKVIIDIDDTQYISHFFQVESGGNNF
jgi:anti-anti-sigma regulatory factor